MSMHLYWVVVRKGTNHAFAAFLAKCDAEQYIIDLGEFGINYEIKSMESYINEQSYAN